jgi:hypothetical protein
MFEFLSPLGWLVACGAVLPVVAAAVRERRERAVRGALGLVAARSPARYAGAAAAVLAVLLFAAATARPAVRRGGTAQLRTDAAAYVVVDISRSMLARRGSHGKTRYARALAAAKHIRDALPDVPFGIASLTNRPLPHLFPSGNRATFDAVLTHALGIEKPPPEIGIGSGRVSTSYTPIVQLASADYFLRTTKRRVVILLTDGESEPFVPGAIATQLQAEHVHLLIVRFWDAAERVYTDGKPERYRPDPGSLVPLKQLAAVTSRQPVFEGRETKRVVHTVRRLIGDGPSVTIGRARRLELAPYAALAAILPIAFVLRRRDP